MKGMAATTTVTVFNFTINRHARVNYFGQEHVNESIPLKFRDSTSGDADIRIVLL